MTRTWAGRAAYLRRRRAARRETLLAMLGGACVRCGTDDRLQFDHVVPGSRVFLLAGDGLDHRWELVLAEAAKCQLLCDPCHRAKSKECGEAGGGHNKNNDPYEHGTPRMYQEQACRCPDCREAKRQYRTHLLGYTEQLTPL